MSTTAIPAWDSLTEPVLRRGRDAAGQTALVLIHDNGETETVTAADFSAGVLARAGGLRAAGLRAADVVLLALGHSRALPESFYAALVIGAIPAILPAHLIERAPTSDEARRRLREYGDLVDAAAIVAADACREAVAPILAPRRVLGDSALAAAAALRPDALHVPDGEDYAFIQFSSGSGGRQKAIAHRHQALLLYLQARVETRPEFLEDVVASWLPLSHDFGLLIGLLTPQLVGSQVVLISPHHWARQPVVWLRAIHEFRATLSGVPNFALNHCAKAVREQDMQGIRLDSLDALMCAGEPVRVDSIEMFGRRFAPYGLRPHVLRVGYGMAEAIEAATLAPRGGAPRVDWIDRQALLRGQRARPTDPARPGSCAVVSCGVPVGGGRVRVVDAEGRPVGDRIVGEIVIQSPWLFDGYYRQPEQGGDTLRDGWLYSGDLGYVVDGELFVTGRKKDLIIVGGRNIAPEDLELVADRIPGLRPGRSVAFAVTDSRIGTDRAILVCEAAAELSPQQGLDIVRALRTSVAETFEISLGDVRIVEPGWTIKTSSGKTARPANRDKYLSEFGASPSGSLTTS